MDEEAEEEKKEEEEEIVVALSRIFLEEPWRPPRDLRRPLWGV